MSEVYKSIIKGLQEAVDDSEGKGTRLRRRHVTVVPVKEYDAETIRMIRNATGFSQAIFAGYLGVSVKTVEAWEAGVNRPSGAASRLLNMMEIDHTLTERFPFVRRA